MTPKNMIDDFRDKKLVEYLEPGQRVLIRFGHGWGDTQMFMPLFKRLHGLFPLIRFDLYLEFGQEEIYESVPSCDKEGEGYDLVFSLNFPMAEGSGLTKAEKCCVDELGIHMHEEPYFLRHHARCANPFVLCHFQGTALPNSVNCPEAVAQGIWQEVIEAGKIPIECHFEHIFHNPVNQKYGFIDNNVRRCIPKLSTLIGMVQNSFAFIGVASGPLITALCVNPDRVFYLMRSHQIENYIRIPVQKIDVTDYKKGVVRNWLESLKD